MNWLGDSAATEDDGVAHLVRRYLGGFGPASPKDIASWAGLPASTYPAFREAVEAMREGGFVGDPGGATRLKRRMVERVLTGCADEELGDIEPLMTLLRRFAAEAAREEARMFCDELVADDAIEPQYGQAA